MTAFCKITFQYMTRMLELPLNSEQAGNSYPLDVTVPTDTMKKRVVKTALFHFQKRNERTNYWGA